MRVTDRGVSTAGQVIGNTQRVLTIHLHTHTSVADDIVTAAAAVISACHTTTCNLIMYISPHWDVIRGVSIVDDTFAMVTSYLAQFSI